MLCSLHAHYSAAQRLNGPTKVSLLVLALRAFGSSVCDAPPSVIMLALFTLPSSQLGADPATWAPATAGTSFEAWKLEHGKSYADAAAEEKARRAWLTNDQTINTHNAKGLSWTLGHNEYTDMLWDEFSEAVGLPGLAPRPTFRESRPVFEAPAEFDAPTAVDWVAKGAVTPVKNQGRCGSCWAFSTTGSVEGANFIANGNLVSLSEEELVQCSNNGNHGCQGGLMDNAFKWIETTGLCLESSDPYTSGGGSTGTCSGKSATCAPNVTVTGFTDVKKGDEAALLAAAAQQPVSIAIEADKSAFQMYKGGILDNPACGTKLDHGVLLVGFGTDSGKDYWKIKNSWGATWGEKGYIRFVRGKNQCGLANQPSFPTGAKPAGPRPPAPPPPPPHYENPAGGCAADEHVTKMTGVPGSWCAPSCIPLLKPCPKNVPEGVKAVPFCSVPSNTTAGGKSCALTCIPLILGCGPNMTCHKIPGSETVEQPNGGGVCTYA